MIEFLDRSETTQQAEEVLALIDNLRPTVGARLISRFKLKLMYAISGDRDRFGLVENATTNTLYWELEDGEFIEQEVTLDELPFDN